MNLLFIGIVATLLLGVIYVLQKGFNQVIKAMESIDARLKRLEDKAKD